MKRRAFITLLGGAAVWPLTARAQQGERMRHVGVLMPSAADDPVGQIRLGAFLQGLQPLGWVVGMCGSTSAGPRAMPVSAASTRQNWSHSRRM